MPKRPKEMVKDTIKKDIFEAMKNRDTKKVGVLRFLVSLIDKKELQLPSGTMQEKDQIAVLQKELKNKEESLEIFAKAGRGELAKETEEEIEVLKKYLPQALSEEELSILVDEAVAGVGANFGLVMREVVGKVAGRASGDVISRIVKERLSKQ